MKRSIDLGPSCIGVKKNTIVKAGYCGDVRMTGRGGKGGGEGGRGGWTLFANLVPNALESVGRGKREERWGDYD